MIDPVLAQIAHSSQPLIVCDIDEVVLEFLDPFDAYLQSVAHRLHADSFHLDGNIRSLEGVPATREMVAAFQEEFFATQNKWQRPAKDSKKVLDRLSKIADIVFLTAMPPRHHALRRGLLDLHGFDYPLIATEEPKGPVVCKLIGDRNIKAVFIDDITSNLHSVRENASGCLLINLMANDAFRAMAPHPGERVERADSWKMAGEMIERFFNISGQPKSAV